MTWMNIIEEPSYLDGNRAGTDSLAFSPGNWDQPQQVTVPLIDNNVADGQQRVSIRNVASGADYDGVASELELIIGDDDSPPENITLVAAPPLEFAESVGSRDGDC